MLLNTSKVSKAFIALTMPKYVRLYELFEQPSYKEGAY